MQRFIADGCREALLEEKRRFCFLVDKHCILSDQTASFHDKVTDQQTMNEAFFSQIECILIRLGSMLVTAFEINFVTVKGLNID